MIKFIEIYPNHRWIEKDGQRVGELTRMAQFNNKWLIEINGARKVHNNQDCFTLNDAKSAVKQILMGE